MNWNEVWQCASAAKERESSFRLSSYSRESNIDEPRRMWIDHICGRFRKTNVQGELLPSKNTVAEKQQWPSYRQQLSCISHGLLLQDFGKRQAAHDWRKLRSTATQITQVYFVVKEFTKVFHLSWSKCSWSGKVQRSGRVHGRADKVHILIYRSIQPELSPEKLCDGKRPDNINLSGAIT